MKSQDRFLSLTLTAIGVVYGDIGTSPLYTIRECFFGEHGVQPTHDNVLGVLSLIIYSLVLVVSVKYIAIVMRADNEGEGGILALMALMPSRPTPILLGLFGAALLYGDGMIPPAIYALVAVAGAWALCAVFGSIGRRAIRYAGFALVLPGLLLNCFGQGALRLHDPDAAHHPFFLLAPGWALYPLVALATAAAIIASQALIT